MLSGQHRFAAVVFSCWLIFAALFAVRASAQAVSTLSLPEYLQELDALQARIEALDAGDAEAVRAMRASLRPLRVSHAGESTDVSFSWLDESIERMVVQRGRRDDLKKQVRERLAAMREEAQRLEPPEENGEGQPVHTISPVDARSRLESILKQPEFGKVREPTWLDRLRERIFLAIARVLDAFFGWIGASPVTGGMLVWALIALFLILVALWVRRILARQMEGRTLELPFSRPVRLNWQQWAREALEAAQRGNHRLAVHNLYWAFIFRLEEMGAWKLDRARTHREYLRLLPAQHPHRGPLDGVTRRFEAVWYAGRAATADDFREAANYLEGLGCVLGSIPQTGKS
jgi:hypothetical protein